MRTGDPAANTSAPTGDLTNSGWQYEVLWGGFTATPIAPNYLLSAKHIGNQGDTFLFGGVTYHVTALIPDPMGDLQILRVAETLPLFAPLYSRSDEIGKRIAVFGRGTQRGAEILLGNVRHGWAWGTGDGVLRWGENFVTGIYPFGAQNDLLYAAFDEAGLPNECHLSVGDSGGAAFINDNGLWKLAGIHYAVDGPYYTDAQGGGQFFGALYDASGFFEFDGTGYVPSNGPTNLYPTRISTRLPWIALVIAQPTLSREVGFAVLTSTRFVVPASDLTYVVERSSDLLRWQPATTIDEVISTNGSVQIVKSKVALENGPVFLRLRITR